MHWLWVILIGLVVGALAKLITPGKDPGGFIVTILIGIAGSIVATWLGRAIGWYQEGQSAGFIMSLVGAVLLLGIYHLIRRRSAQFESAVSESSLTLTLRSMTVLLSAGEVVNVNTNYFWCLVTVQQCGVAICRWQAVVIVATGRRFNLSRTFDASPRRSIV